jgi:hypothetical protein
MVAGASSCSCPECGVVCKGKFPGCATVWAAGPQQVSFRRPTKELGSRSAPLVPATNGTRAQDHAAEPPRLPAVPGSRTGTGADTDLRPLMEALWADVRALRRQVDEVRKVSVPSEPLGEATLQALSMLENLPHRIARAAGEAMRQQHQLNLRDLKEQWGQFAAQTEQVLVHQARKLEASPQVGNVDVAVREAGDARREQQLEDLRNEWRQFAAQIESSLDVQLKEIVARVRAAEVDVATRTIKEMAAHSAASDPATIMQEFDARFEWLVNELSDRFVILGNELVRIEKRLADEGLVAPVTNGQLPGRAPAPME